MDRAILLKSLEQGDTGILKIATKENQMAEAACWMLCGYWTERCCMKDSVESSPSGGDAQVRETKTSKLKNERYS